MTVLPDVSMSIVDRALGLSANTNSAGQVKVGVCTAGTVYTRYSFNDKTTLVSTLVGGPAVEAAALVLVEQGGPVDVIPTAASVAGTAGTIAQVSGSNTPPMPTIAGTPNDLFEGLLLIVAGGAVGTSTFQYSLDNGNTWSPVIATAATYVITGTGLTITWTAGTYVAADVYGWTSTAPMFNTTDLTTALSALNADPGDYSICHIVGQAGGVSDSARQAAAAAIIAVVETAAAAANGLYHYPRFIVELPDPIASEQPNGADAAIITAIDAVVAPHVAPMAGSVQQASAITGRVNKRHSAWTALSRLQNKPLGEDPGRVARGALPPSVVSIGRDEAKTPALDAHRIGTLRTFVGGSVTTGTKIVGFFITEMPLLSNTGSDYKYLQHGQVIDEACRITLAQLRQSVNDDLLVNADGTIEEGQAQAIEGLIASKLTERLVATRQVSAAGAKINRTDNLLSTQNLRASVRVRPKGYIKAITVDIGFAFNIPIPAPQV